MSLGNAFLPSGLLILVITSAAFGQELQFSAPDRAEIVDHRLRIELHPDAHRFVGRDETTVAVPAGITTVTFTLASALRVESIGLFREPRAPEPARPAEALTFTTELLSQPSTQRIVVTLPDAGERRATLVWTYGGTMHDPPKEPRHLRFVTPSETTGHIGPEGVYLSSESQWYPDIEGSLSTFQVTADVPREWTVVTQGTTSDEALQQTRRISTWTVRDRSEALTLVANAFVTQTRSWRGPNGQDVQLATYFFPAHADLADEYLEAAAQYLDLYVPLLGAYPFEKFAVVENFFASGLGMPSFTLLGSGSIQRHYVQPYALGHEIVHSWIGNSVFNRTERGNWVEGLTTYLANYYWHEVTRDFPQAREQRRLMMQGYSLYVSPDREYPVAEFRQKRDEVDNAIGYQKSAFLFHLLRQEIGDESFWRGLKTLVSRFQNRHADWENLEQVFAETSGQDLRWFFAQWVEQAGAPVVSLREVTASRLDGAEQQGSWKLTVQLQQAGKPFRLRVPLEIDMNGKTETRWVPISRSEERVELVLPFQPLLARLDPDLLIFRRIARASLPPMLNMYVTDAPKAVVQAFEDPESPLQQVVARITAQEAPLLQEEKTRQVRAIPEAIPPTGSVLVLTASEQQAVVRTLIRESCGERVVLQAGGFQIDGRTYEGPAWAVLFSCHRAGRPGSVITALYGVTPQAVAKVSRLLFFYGWQSVVIFRDGAVDRREVWEPDPDMKEVQVHGHS